MLYWWLTIFRKARFSIISLSLTHTQTLAFLLYKTFYFKTNFRISYTFFNWLIEFSTKNALDSLELFDSWFGDPK